VHYHDFLIKRPESGDAYLAFFYLVLVLSHFCFQIFTHMFNNRSFLTKVQFPRAIKVQRRVVRVAYRTEKQTCLLWSFEQSPLCTLLHVRSTLQTSVAGSFWCYFNAMCS